MNNEGKSEGKCSEWKRRPLKCGARYNNEQWAHCLRAGIIGFNYKKKKTGQNNNNYYRNNVNNERIFNSVRIITSTIYYCYHYY